MILMDLVMPGLDGIGAMRQLSGRSPASRVIVLTSFLEDERVLPAIQAGAAGSLLQNVARPCRSPIPAMLQSGVVVHAEPSPGLHATMYLEDLHM